MIEHVMLKFERVVLYVVCSFSLTVQLMAGELKSKGWRCKSNNAFFGIHVSVTPLSQERCEFAC